MKRSVLFAMVMAVWSVCVHAHETPFLDAKVKTLVTFKDGTVFVLKQGTVTVDASGKVITSPIIDAAFGTVGVDSMTKGVTVKMLAASRVDDLSGRVSTFADARASAHGRPISVRRRDSDTTITGELLTLGSPQPISAAVGMPSATAGDDLVLSIKQSNGIISLIPLSDLEEWRFLDSKAVERDPGKTGQHLTITLDGAKPGQEVTIAYYYLWSGVRWSPSYLLDRDDTGRVHLKLRGELTNHLLDLKGTRVYLAVGVPNFAFIKTPSPLAAQKTLQQVTSALRVSQLDLRNDFTNSQFTQMVTNSQVAQPNTVVEARPPAADAPAHAPAAELPNAASTDAGTLHLFEVENVDLARGERAILHLSSMTLDCADLVTWDIGDSRVQTAMHVDTPQDRATNPLVHHWLLKAGDTPLTTGPALVMKKDVALSQDTIYYTPRHTAGRFRVGEAVGVSGVASETVLSRENGSLEVKDRQDHYQGRPFWLMREIRWIDESRELTVTVKNGLAFKTDVEVTRQFRGRPTAVEGVSLQTLGGMGETEDQLNRLTWKTSLEPGKENSFKIRYVARVFTKK